MFCLNMNMNDGNVHNNPTSFKDCSVIWHDVNCNDKSQPDLTMPQYKLVLYPAVPEFTQLDSDVIITALKKCGLISAVMHENTFLPGDTFIELLSFLGCSPNIVLKPSDGDHFCHVRIKPVLADVHCLGHIATAIPRCPRCKHKLADWQQTPDWQLGATACTCPACHINTAMQNLDWKQACAYGRMAIDILNIHPFEAVPSESLLTILQTVTNVEWNYCYAENK